MSTVVDIEYGTTIVAVTCGVCHIPFGLPSGLYDKAQRDGSWFYCPNGHNIHYLETENKKLKTQVDNLTTTKDRLMRQRDEAKAEAEHQRRVAIGTKGALVKTQRRVAKGVCPCCNRQFVNVARHMSMKHPKYGGSA